MTVGRRPGWSAKVSLRDDLNLIAPRLRRYARALVCACPGPSEAADTLVGAALRQVFAGGASPPPPDLEIEAYAALVLLNREQMSAPRNLAALHRWGAWLERLDQSRRRARRRPLAPKH